MQIKWHGEELNRVKVKRKRYISKGCRTCQMKKDGVHKNHHALHPKNASNFIDPLANVQNSTKSKCRL